LVTDEVWQKAVLASSSPAIPQEVLQWVREREAARQMRDWARADALRRQVLQLGWQIQDTPGGPEILPI